MSANFWILKYLEYGRGYGQRAEYLADGPLFQTIDCPQHEGHQRSGDRIGNLKIIVKGSQVGDIVWTQDHDCLIQPHLLTLLNEKGFTGFETKPVEKIVAGNRKVDARNLSLHELVVMGWAGDASADSGVHLLSYCPHCHLSKFSGVSDPLRLIDLAQWDGSDFFQVWPLPQFIFVTERVAKFLENGKYKGCRLIPLERFESLYGTLGPGLPAHFKTHQRFKYNEHGEIENWEELVNNIPWENIGQGEDDRIFLQRIQSLPEHFPGCPDGGGHSRTFYLPQNDDK